MCIEVEDESGFICGINNNLEKECETMVAIVNNFNPQTLGEYQDEYLAYVMWHNEHEHHSNFDLINYKEFAKMFMREFLWAQAVIQGNEIYLYENDNYIDHSRSIIFIKTGNFSRRYSQSIYEYLYTVKQFTLRDVYTDEPIELTAVQTKYKQLHSNNNN